MVEGPGRTCDREYKAKLRDGGTYENTGMMTVMDLVPEIREAIKRSKPEPTCG